MGDIEKITTEEATRVLQREYYEEIRALAASIAKESKADRRDVSDVMHETIDGHEWVIYTWKAQRLLWLSDNSDSMFEETGERGEWSEMAYWALRADVEAHMPAIDDDDDEGGR